MKTLRQVQAWARKHDYLLSGYRKGTWHLNGIASIDDNGDAYCCAMPEFGYFEADWPYRLEEITQEQWEMLLTFYIRTSKHPFFRTTTTARKQYKHVNAALQSLGFMKEHTVRSKHGGHYQVYMWFHPKV